uniref:Uncharacterized protein n=1 Tax=Panagrolaimus sp. ES5 TaxID=591445 RepID=A0AC34GPX2_9BILA
MFEDLCIFVGIPAILAVITYFTYQYIHSGLTAPIEVSEKPHLSILQRATTLFYKHHVGAYSAHRSILSELKDLLPQGASTIQIFYDDEAQTPARNLQSAIGCIFGEDGEDFYTHNFSVQLKRFGFERLVLSPVTKVLHVSCPHNGSIFSRLNMAYRVYPALNAAYEKLQEKPAPKLIIQVIDTSTNSVDCFIPLESIENFLDVQYMTPDEMVGKLARKKFDSDEESSESEPDVSDNEAQDQEEDDKEESEVEEENKKDH